MMIYHGKIRKESPTKQTKARCGGTKSSLIERTADREIWTIFNFGKACLPLPSNCSVLCWF